MNDEHNLEQLRASTVPSQNSLPDGQDRELRLRVLHDFLYEAMSFPSLASDYTAFVRSLRERLHPVGVWETRVAEPESGLKFQVDLGDRLGCDIYYGYYQESFESQLLFNLLNSGSIFLDIGANFGYYAVTAAKLTGSEGTVCAFEPNEDAYKLLQANVEINGFQEIVRCHQACVGAEDGETDFYVSEESSFSGMSPTGRSKLRQKVRVPVCTLDSILSQLELSQIDAMKIDVEGYEFAVLRGAMETLRRSPNLVIVMEVSAKNLDEQRSEALISALTDVYELGFRGWVVDSTPQALRLLETPQEAIAIGAANLFLTLCESGREEQLHNAYQDLRVKAFRGIAKEIGLPAQQLLHRNRSDPQGYYKLYGALLDCLLRDRDATIDRLDSKILELENSYQALAKLSQERQAQLNQLSQERQTRLKELHKRDMELVKSKRDKEFVKFQAEIARLETESQARLKEIHKRDARLDKLQEEVEFLKKELSLSIKDKVVRKIKKSLKVKNDGHFNDK